MKVFPDQFHLATLSKLLAATAKLVHAVNVMQIIAALIDRLAKYLNEDGKSERSEDLFEIFWREVGGLIEVTYLSRQLASCSNPCFVGQTRSKDCGCDCNTC